MNASKRTFRTVVALWVFAAAQVPATVVLVSMALLLGAASIGEVLGALALPLLALTASSGAFAWIIAKHVTEPFTRVRAMAALASRSGAEGPALIRAVRSEHYVETESVMRALQVLHQRSLDERRHRDTLATYVAHDLRTPIAAIAMRVADNSSGSTGLANDVAHVLDEMDQLVEILRRGTGDGYLDHARTTNVGPAVAAVVAAQSHPAGIAVTVDVITPFVAAVSPSALRSVAQNLVTNALRHAESRVKVIVSRGMLHVENDYGAGVSGTGDAGPSVLRSHGLGLSIARHMLHSCGGHLRVHDDDARAFVAIAYLPVASTEAT